MRIALLWSLKRGQCAQGTIGNRDSGMKQTGKVYGNWILKVQSKWASDVAQLVECLSSIKPWLQATAPYKPYKNCLSRRKKAHLPSQFSPSETQTFILLNYMKIRFALFHSLRFHVIIAATGNECSFSANECNFSANIYWKVETDFYLQLCCLLWQPLNS